MDKIIIKTKNNQEVSMEVVLTYDFKDNKYVIYKDNLDTYIAKYDALNNNLDTNLSNEEITFGLQVLEGVKNA